MVTLIQKNIYLKRSICLFCSMGCGTAFRTLGTELTAIDYDKANPINLGALCARGHYNFELLNHPHRLTRPQIGNRQTSWDDALAFARQQLKEFNADEIGIVLSSNASNEDALQTAELARTIGTKNLIAAGNAFDQESYLGQSLEANGAGLAQMGDLGKVETLLVVGDVLRRTPVLSWRVNQVKYGKRGNKVIVLDPNQTHTSWFATSHLKNRPGTEALVLLAMLELIGRATGQGELGVDLDKIADKIGLPVELLKKSAQDFHSSSSGAIVVAPGPAKQRNDLIVYLAKLLASVSPGKKYITFFGYGNTLGVSTVLERALPERTSYHEFLNKLGSEQIKALIMLGEDITINHQEIEKKIRRMKFTLLAKYFPDGTIDESMVALPLASWMEESGSYIMADGRVEKLEPLAPKVGARSIGEIAAALMDQPLDKEKAAAAVRTIIDQGLFSRKADLDRIKDEAEKIEALDSAAADDLTHFGNNQLVRNFFWFRANNRTEEKR